MCHIKYEPDSENGRRIRRITDHVRACTMAIHENVYPGRDKAKYVVRRLIRRAVLDGYQMDLREPFLHKLVPAVAEASKSEYPELCDTMSRVAEVIAAEENAFFGTIDGGMTRIGRLFEQMRDEAAVMVPGDEAADLNKTYGVPPELLQTIAAEQNFTFDWSGYRDAMDQHAKDSGAGQKELFQTGPLESLKESLRITKFTGYDETSCQAVVKGIVTDDGSDEDHEGQLVTELAADAKATCRLVLDTTPFYGESGGQVGDVGTISGDGFTFEVADTQKHGDLIVHVGKLTAGKVTEGTACNATVDTDRRDAIRRAHSATHILHYALQKNLGSHAQQQGSKVEPDWLRFDFSNQEAIDESTLVQIRKDVLEQVETAQPVSWKNVSLADARAAGAMMLFGEKYPDPVRMVSMGEYSKELCGGTHLDSTGDVQAFELISEESVSAGTRRVIAVTGPKAAEHREQTISAVTAAAQLLGCESNKLADETATLVQSVRQIKKELQSGKATAHPESLTGKASASQLDYPAARQVLRDAARALNVAPSDVATRIEALLGDRVKLLKQVAQMTAGGQISADDLIAGGETIGDTLVVVAETPGANPNVMRGWIDQIRKKSDGPTAVLFAAAQGPKVLFVGGLSKALVERGLKAGDWVGGAAKITGGGGGGRPDMAQAGGKDATKLPEALEAAKASMREQL